MFGAIDFLVRACSGIDSPNFEGSWILRNLTFIYPPAASRLGHARSGAPRYAEKHSGNSGHTAVGEGLRQLNVCVGASLPRDLLIF